MKLYKRRYLALKIDSEYAPSAREILDSIWKAITQLYGEYGASYANLSLIDYDINSKIAIVRVNLIFLQNLRAALASICSISENPLAMHVIAISGTIKALCKKINLNQTKNKTFL